MEVRAKVFQSRGGHRSPALRIVTHRLTKARGYCPTGSRYMTRANIRRVLMGLTAHAIVRNDGSGRYPKQARAIRAHVRSNRLRIGCHVWTGDNFRALADWALA
jgi:hypothetical protein